MTAPERWLPVVGYEGLYEVSDHGNVKSRPRRTTRGGILRSCADKKGRIGVNLTLNGKQKYRRVHQLVMEAFAGPPEPGQEVRHLDGNPADNRWAPGATEEEVRAAGGNLFYGTHAENMRDMVEHGTSRPHTTECPQGHLYDEKNTGWCNGAKFCRQCSREKGLARYHATRVPADMTATCKHCGKVFEREKPGQRFCSRECIDTGGWYARRPPHVPAADLSPGERERRNARSREYLRRYRARKREEKRGAA